MKILVVTIMLLVLPHVVGSSSLSLPRPVIHPVSIPRVISPDDIKLFIVQMSREYRIPASLPLMIAARESKFNHRLVHCCNYDGSRDWGVMQLNDYTVRSLKIKDPLDYKQNVRAGVMLLASYLREYKGDLQRTLCAYAKGPGNCVRTVVVEP